MAVWRQRLEHATSTERWLILEAWRKAEQLSLQESVRDRCWASPIGLVDCSTLATTTRLRRWCRHRGALLAEFESRERGSGETRFYRWRLGRV